MAKFYPRSEFVGIDMADVFVTENKPSNVTFKVANAGIGFEFEDESFDFVFQRFLVMGFPTEQYLYSIKEIKRILKPEGYIEILELINDYREGGPALTKISSWIHQALEARQMDSFIANKIPNYLLDAGYKNVRDFDYAVSIGSWGGELGQLHLAIQKLALPAVEVMVTELTPITSEQYNVALEQAFKEVDQYKASTHYKLIYATKE
ncbi:hypothetical protein G6F56_012027 [Rhizopus delemar]|nr:hypothetical protein G6F56_012027 [Rhizopus delemar]